MNLHTYQRTVMRVLFAREPAIADLHTLGNEPRWQTYRHMVRTRIEDMSRKAFKATCGLIGEETFGAAFALYLEEASPSSALIRDVVAAFGAFLQQLPELSASKPWAFDMLRFERACWEVAYQQASAPAVGEDGVRELDFEGTLVLNPVLRILTLEHPVQRDEAAWPNPEQTYLLVYRTIGANEIRWWAATHLLATLLARAQTRRESVAEAVRGAALTLGRPIDQALLESLSSDLTLAIQRSVIVGVR